MAGLIKKEASKDTLADSFKDRLFRIVQNEKNIVKEKKKVVQNIRD